MTPRNVTTCSTKLKTSSSAATCIDMSANNPPSLTADPPETRHLDPKAPSRSKSTSSSAGQPRAVIAPRHEKLMRDPRSGRGHCMTKTLTLHDRSISEVHHHQSTSHREHTGKRLGQASLLLRDRHAVRNNGENHRALCQLGGASCRRGRWKLDQRNP
ncbi:hypothetical protein B296_00037056 [Ensete ventricosum]|uniref:Uncharacterized protein n=1 Tax=Ensete ventricosum TaxID=4639 RepID=A0A426X010_ENSVE|nr:hypothetical protein B296_00037056 [Ensete ventricosum]